MSHDIFTRVINQLNRELDFKDKELGRKNEEIAGLRGLVDRTIDRLSNATEEIQRLRRAENEFYRLGVIDERDDLQERLRRLKEIK